MEIKYCDRVKGKGLFTLGVYKTGDIVMILSGVIKSLPDKYSIEIGKDKHITDEQGIYINHSFEPSVKISKHNVMALREMKVGDEICFNYNNSESVMASPFYVGDILVSGVNDMAIKERFTIRPSEKDVVITNIENIIDYISSTSGLVRKSSTGSVNELK